MSLPSDSVRLNSLMSGTASDIVIPPGPLLYDDTISTLLIDRVLFVNSAAAPLQTYANSTTFTVVYDSSSSLEDVWELMRRKFPAKSLSRVGFAFHNNGDLTSFCGNETWFTDADLEVSQTVFSKNTQFILDILREFKVDHVDYLACDTLISTKWRKYFQLVQTQTGVIVGASDNNTGNVKYGGDWIMESTMEDIREVYFSPAIENYAELLVATMTVVATVGTYNESLAIYGNYLFTSAGLKIVKIDLTTNTVVNSNVFTSSYAPPYSGEKGFRTMCVFGNYLYFNNGPHVVGRLNITDGTVEQNWITGLNAVWSIITDGTYLYITNYIPAGYIVRVLLNYTGVAPAAFITGLNYPVDHCIHGSYLYTLDDTSFIRKYDVATGVLVTANLTNRTVSYGSSIFGSGSFLYVGTFRRDNNAHGITQISLDGTTVYNTAYFVNADRTGGYLYYTNVTDMVVYNNKLYCASHYSGFVFSVDLPALPTPFISTRPTAAVDSITYPATMGTVSLTGGSALSAVGGTVVAGTFSISASISSTVYNVGTYTDVSATFFPSDAAYSSVSTSIPSITVLKATPYVATRPTSAFGNYPNKLSSLVTIGGTSTVSIGGADVSGTFIVHPDLSNSIYAEGVYQDVSAVFVPTSSINYNSVATSIQTVTITRGSTTIATVSTPGIAAYNGSWSCTIGGDLLYVAAGRVIKVIDLRTNTLVNSNLYTSDLNVSTLHFRQGYLYFRSGNSIASTVGKVNASTGALVSTSWISGSSGQQGIVSDDTYLYLANPTSIFRAPITGGTATSFITGLTSCKKIAIHGSYLYVPDNGLILKYNVSTGALVSSNFTTLPYLNCLMVHNDVLYAGQIHRGNIPHGIMQIGLDGTILNSYFFVKPETMISSFYTNVQDIAIYNNKMYCATNDYATIISVDMNTVPYISSSATAASSITYPTTIGSVVLSSGSALDVSGGSTAVPGTFGIRMDISNVVYDAGTYTNVSATFYPTDKATYSYSSTSVPTISVLKATPYLATSPISATVVFPNKLSAVVITGGSCTVTNGGAAVTGTFTVSLDLSNSIYAVGTYQNVPAIFNPTSGINYNTITTTIPTLTVTQVAPSQLGSLGISATDLKTAGYSATDLKTAGFTSTQQKTAGFTATEQKTAGFTIAELKTAGFTATEQKTAGFTVTEQKTAGYTATELKTAGFTATEQKTAGFTATQQKTAGFTTTELKTAGFTIAEQKTAGFSATDLRTAGFTATEQKTVGFTAVELKTAGFTATEQKTAGFTIAELKTAGFTATEQKTAGSTLSELISATYTTSQLKSAAFTPTELITAGISTTSLYNVFTTTAETKSVTKAVVSGMLTSTAKTTVPLSSLVGYSFASTVQSGIAIKVTDVNAPAIISKSEMAKGLAVVYAVLDVASCYTVLPTWSSSVKVMNIGNEIYRVYDSNGTTILDNNLVAGDTRTYDGLTIVIGSLTATLAVQPNVDFVLSGLNSYITLSTSAEIPNYSLTLSTDATLTLNTSVSASVLQDTFFYRTDDPINLDASFVYHYVDTTKWLNQSTTLSPKNGIVTANQYVSNDSGGKDFLRDLARQLFGTYLAADLFTNENAVVADINTKFDNVATNIVSLLSSIDKVSGSLSGMVTDESGKKYLKDDTSTSNITREILNELMTSAPNRFLDIKTNYLYNSVEDGYYKIPFIPGDTISFKVTVCPATGQTAAVPTGKTSLTNRSYTVVLNVS
jgi:ribosomal protein L13E